MYNNKKQHKNTKKIIKKESEFGLDPPTHQTTSEFFSSFWIFLTWQNP